ncbi:MAG TPA: DSD1 family PLP-dependent enzyme [Chloroflexota bacterium]|jgi:D-serine deaminase-like pyridoxal phosphate-dependent protein
MNAIGSRKLDLDTPALLVDLDVLERNIERMARTFREAGVGWRPHTKAIKVPALAHKLMSAGAFGVTCAKLGEAEVMAAGGVRDILIANQIVGPPKIDRLMAVLGTADVIVAVDSVDNVRQLDRAASAAGQRLRVVVEVDIGMRRAGVLPGQPTVDLARLVASCAGLKLAGVFGWEGQTIKIADPAEKQRAIAQAVGLLAQTAEQCRAAGLEIDIVSCGGTGTYQHTATLPGITELQAGGGIFCDVYYREIMHVDHDFALTVLSTVTSRPTPTRVICDAGKKTMSSDAAMPRPRIREAIRSMGLSAEHTTLELAEPTTDLAVGDKIEFIVGYSDTTTMLHEELFGIRQDRVELVWPILGRGKLR